MAKKGQLFQQYMEAFKLAAVQLYVEEPERHSRVAEKLGIRN
jgi:transposase-like protein